MLELLLRSALQQIAAGALLVTAEPDEAGGWIIRLRPVAKGS